MRFTARFLTAITVGLMSGALFAGSQAINVITQPANVTDFGVVAIGQSVTRSITLTAPATNTAPIGDLIPTFPPGFALAPGGTCESVNNGLNPGQSCTFNVTYTPFSTSTGGGALTATCTTNVVAVVTGFVVICDTQNASQLALFVASAFNSAVPVMSPLWMTLLALGLLGFGARSALGRAKR